MKNNRIYNFAFIISLLGHVILLIGMPAINLHSQNINEKEIELHIEIEKPKLLPKIEKLGNVKKIAKVETKEEIIEEPALKKAPQLKIEEIKESKDDEDEEAMFRYQDMIKRRIQEVRRYPRWAKRQGHEGFAEVSFVVLSDGSVQHVKIVRSSGFKILDNESLATINRAAPFQPIPVKNIPQTQMQVRIVFDLN